MVGKKKQQYTYDHMLEGIIDKMITIQPNIMAYKNQLMTEMLREKYLNPNAPIKKTKKCYTQIIINDEEYFKDELNMIWSKNNTLSGITRVNEHTHEDEYYLFTDIKKHKYTYDKNNIFTLLKQYIK